MTTKIRMGHAVKDAVSGFSGIVVSIHEFMNGCRRITVQPPVGADGKLPETATFDEPQLDVTGDGLISRVDPAPPQARTGGPARYVAVAGAMSVTAIRPRHRAERPQTACECNRSLLDIEAIRTGLKEIHEKWVRRCLCGRRHYCGDAKDR